MINAKNLHINETAQKTALKSRIVFLSNKYCFQKQNFNFASENLNTNTNRES